WVAHDLAYRLLAELRIRLYETLVPLAPGYLLRRRSGDVSSVMAGDIETVELFFAHTISPAMVAVAVPVAVVGVLAFIAWPVALALIPLLILVGASPIVGQRQTERAGREVREQLGMVHAHALDTVQGMREVLSFG